MSSSASVVFVAFSSVATSPSVISVWLAIAVYLSSSLEVPRCVSSPLVLS